MKWRRTHTSPHGGTCGARYTLFEGERSTQIEVHHCGHPTANWPYTVELRWPPFQLIGANGRAFPRLAVAQAAGLRHYLQHTGRLPA